MRNWALIKKATPHQRTIACKISITFHNFQTLHNSPPVSITRVIGHIDSASPIIPSFSRSQEVRLPNASGSRTTNRCGPRQASSPSPQSPPSPDLSSTRPTYKIAGTTRSRSPTSKGLPGPLPNSRSNVSQNFRSIRYLLF